jgi:hypothetical protein
MQIKVPIVPNIYLAKVASQQGTMSTIRLQKGE